MLTWKRGDSQGRSPLTIAAAYGKVAVASEMLARGANPLAQDSVYHDTPMHYAAIVGSIEMVDLLLTQGVDVNCTQRPSGGAPSFLRSRRR